MKDADPARLARQAAHAWASSATRCSTSRRARRGHRPPGRRHGRHRAVARLRGGHRAGERRRGGPRRPHARPARDHRRHRARAGHPRAARHQPRLYDNLNGTLAARTRCWRSSRIPTAPWADCSTIPTLYNRPHRRHRVHRLARRASAQLEQGHGGLLLRDTTLYPDMVGITTGADSLMRTLTKREGDGEQAAHRPDALRPAQQAGDGPERDPRRRAQGSEPVHEGDHEGLLGGGGHPLARGASWLGAA